MSEMICIRVLVTGRVQGVWFRAGTKQEADQRGITGWAKNLPDGGVEVVACGLRERVLQLQAWLQRGPRAARVEGFQVEEIAWQDYADFTTM